jgi:hypothetical protein
MEDNFYIRGSRKDQALLVPTMSSDALPSGMDPMSFANTWKPISVWRAYFEAEDHKVMPPEGKGSEDSTWEEVESPSLARFSEVESNSKTPKRLKVGSLLESLVETIPIGISKAEPIGRIEDPGGITAGEERDNMEAISIRTVLAEWNKVSASVDVFNAEFSKLGTSETQYREGISSTVLKIHEAIRDTDARAAFLGSRMGYDKTSASGQGDESVWDTIRRLCDSIEQIQDQADSGARAIPGLLESSDDAADKLEILSQNFHGLRKYAQEGINTISRQIRRVETSTQMGASGSVADPNYERLVDRLDELEAQARVYARKTLRSS